MSTILVTGGAGFIGSHTAKALIERGDEVIIVDNFSNYYDPKLKKDRIKNLLPKGKFKLYKCDISNIKALTRIFKKHRFDKICHLAAQAGVRYSLENPFIYEKANNLGTLNLLELCRQFNVTNFIFASSSSVYGGNTKTPFSPEDRVDSPISLYAATKRFNELMAFTYHHLYGINCTGLRFFTVYGPWGRPDLSLFKFTKAILKNEPIEVYNFGKMKRDFTYITDVVSGILAALDKSYSYEIFNLGNSNTVELNYFIGCIEKELGKTAEKKLMPLQPGDVPVTFADISKSKKMLGFNPQVKIEEGIKHFIEWYKKHYGDLK